MPNVRIRIESIKEEEGQTGVPTDKEAEKARKEKIAVASLFAHQAINIAKQVVNYSISNIGSYTGDYIKQERIQNTIGVVSDMSTIAFGAVSGGWVGALIATMGVATKYTLQEINIIQEAKHAENNANYIRERSGNSTKNGSRTGD